MLSQLTSRESEGEPQVGKGDEFVWLVGAKRARKSTNGYFNSTGTPDRSKPTQHALARCMEAVAHATFNDVRRHAVPDRNCHQRLMPAWRDDRTNALIHIREGSTEPYNLCRMVFAPRRTSGLGTRYSVLSTQHEGRKSRKCCVAVRVLTLLSRMR